MSIRATRAPDPWRHLGVKVSFVGVSCSGKTCLIWRGQNPDKQWPAHPVVATLGPEFSSLVGNSTSGRSVRLQIWDTGRFYPGKFDQYVRMFLRGAWLLVICCDVTKRDCFEDVTSCLNLVQQEKPKNSVLPIVYLVGNKVDLRDSRPDSTTRDLLPELLQFAASNPLLSVDRVFETSASTGVGVRELFLHLMDTALHLTDGIVPRDIASHLQHPPFLVATEFGVLVLACMRMFPPGWGRRT